MTEEEWTDAILKGFGALIWLVVMLGLGLAVIRVAFWGLTGG